ncbi:MAG: ribosome maturation factor RimM [Rhodocyclaceae bacterium]|nr:ribosome maturation factor RimM [Rhodocyclaceae bacterium]
MVVLGRITAPYGIKGWLKLWAYGDEPARWKEMPRIWLAPTTDDPAQWREWSLADLRPHGAAWIMKLAGIEDRTAAESLRGHYVGAPRDFLPATAEGEYYWADLIGLQVVDGEGRPLGKVVDLLETGAHDVLVVREETGAHAQERLIPFVSAWVLDVRPEAGFVRVAWERDW